jgi:hypothetical protein
MSPTAICAQPALIAPSASHVDRLGHHADVTALKGDSYQMKNRDLGRVPTARTDEQSQAGQVFLAVK